MSNKIKTTSQTMNAAAIADEARRQERRRLKRIRKREMKAELRTHFARQPGEISSFMAQATELPRNEQLALQSIVDADPDVAAKDYLKTLVLPSYSMSRIPDSYSGATAVVRSTTVVSVPGYFNGDANDGRFAMVVQPHMGKLGDPTQFKIAMVDASQAGVWDAPLNVPAPFVNINNGKDIRTDTFYQFLTQPPLATATYAGDAVTSSQQFPFGATVTNTTGYGLNVPYSSVPALSTFYPPTGFYDVNIRILDDDFVGPAQSILVVGAGGTTVATSFQSNSVDSTLVEWTGYITVPDASLGLTPSFTVSLGQIIGGASVNAATIRLTTTYDDIAGISSNAGLIQKYRPVGCSVLATYTGPLLTNGGNIAACFLPGGAADRQFFTTGNTIATGSLTAWQNVAALKGSYNGPIKDGIYAWYSPENTLDYALRTPDDSVDYTHPNFVISGQWAPGGAVAPPDGQVFMRVEVWTVYELASDLPLLEMKHQKGSQALMDSVLGHLVGQPHTMMNQTHVSFGQKILNAFKSAGQWMWKNRKTIASAVTGLASLV